MSITAARQSLRARNLADETQLVRQLIAETGLDAAARASISAKAEKLVETVRTGNRLGLMESFLAEYGLATDEGVALMSLAEALLRVPDAETVDALIHDKVGGSDWTAHFGASANQLVNFSSWALSLTADVLGDPEVGPKNALHRAIARLGEPVIRTAVAQAMRLLGSQFVFGRTIDEAITNARKPESLGYRYSYDMLGEAARTSPDAARYFDAYARAIASLAPHCTASSVRENPGISVKLSALHPRYEFAQRHRVMAELVAATRKLALAAKAANMGFNIDAEEADRLDLSLDVIAEVLSTPELAGWDGFGVVVQAYGKRVLPLIDWLDATAQSLGRRIMVRLVKGAYWDAEIKRAQVMGLDGYPVFTRKASTDISYIASARKLFAAANIYPQFATHNAHTASAVLHLAAEAGRGADSFEFQRLHGMGERLHEVLRTEHGTRTRIYAPVGAHKDLLAYLVRRLLENGANGSFVYQIADEDIPASVVAEDPIGKVLVLDATPNPAIPSPAAIFAPRQNSTGLDLTDPIAFPAMEDSRAAFATTQWQAIPIVDNRHPLPAFPMKGEVLSGGRDSIESNEWRETSPSNGGGRRGWGHTRETLALTNPANPTDHLGTVINATPADVTAAIAAATTSGWPTTPVASRATLLRATADLYEAHRPELFALLAREAGKTWSDAVAEVREAVDFLRYYAAEAERQPLAIPRGPIAAISPWNFPLAIFTGQIAAALVAGNPILAKPAPQTPLIAYRAVQLMHEAGIPLDAIQLLPGAGEVGTALTSDPAIAGVVFTGSLPTAHKIDRAMAANLSPTAPLIAETGGLNAMIVDSTALPEQAVRDILASAFQSAGQRCSALRVLYLQEDAAERTIEMLKGAMDELTMGNPWDLSTDIGPVIDDAARSKIQAHIDSYERSGNLIHRLNAPGQGTFIAPTVLRVSGIEALKEEIFGPVLHIATFKADQLDAVIEAINDSGYGLTFGLHTRISSRVRKVSNEVHAGNIYINRNQIGAVVGSQPFGGEGLSGTGPKAGGPHYLPRFTQGLGHAEIAPQLLPGPTGESNVMHTVPRGALVCLGPTEADRAAQHALAEAAGCIPLAFDLDLDALSMATTFDAVAWFGDAETLRAIRRALADRDGPILPLLTSASDTARLQIERHVCIDTTAAGGNASLMAQAG
ncbi:MAG: bifunctional proline dehydrogenase/L-glutamate gamma-semialdehyde dehydrogenase PutA [Alphaproteobacteria bacterium]|nr:bifunctional proline dehydrogenase/L-glutamate gamma-semialdehyde dehydrogenase PutA [Alphaproteobacteria bacterium]MBU1563254.1 bifunctional proline dehydrogenase/L-glutamate gamma-semialdehyde dehydrogenase PutA [Alphaproteobacteria bacterium]MBU2303345.1 bifunctional proline dehydrogenase/L-glutamate gamma-semialdehyde dehydrogenase PutA [Alphaproteobacteria bacterium]MBU2368593.1 bifunctional proline dehydrogenase/L-glutamate gamma-semialdehyde dehydrogenase PutA [Alphaproteobacteria bact